MACSEETPSDYIMVKSFPNLNFERPVDFQHAGDGSDRILSIEYKEVDHNVVEQQGKIFVFSNNRNVETKSVFLDITDRVDDSGNEMGLLGLAFHPDFEDNGFFYVNYTTSDPRRTVIARYNVTNDDPNLADPISELVLLEYNQPYSNHNGGQVLFGPDGYLYIAAGDGGSAGDPELNGQNRTTLLGSILRIDVNSQQDGLNYSIPSDNPFYKNDGSYRQEIFAYGLRNPWRFCFEPANGWLWTGDVGQNKIEEIDIVFAGKNYGWNIMEGPECYNPPNCGKKGLELPIHSYEHSEGQSITGGYFYQNGNLSELVGAYIYADFVSGKIWALYHQNGKKEKNILLNNQKNGISSFGLDEQNKLYILVFDGFIYHLDRR